MSVTTCWKRPPRAEHSLSMADRSTVVTVRAMAAASAAAESSFESANAIGTCSHGHLYELIPEVAGRDRKSLQMELTISGPNNHKVSQSTEKGQCKMQLLLVQLQAQSKRDDNTKLARV